jgi:uncharacterized protein
MGMHELGSMGAWHALTPGLVVLVGYIVLGLTGMGSALVVVPLLAQHWPLPEVVTLAILLDIPASLLHGGLNLKHVRWHELLRLLPGMALGTLTGLWLVGQLDRKWPLFFLGLYVVVVAVRALRPDGVKHSVHPRWGPIWGWLAGVIEVMFATSGPVFAAWLQWRVLDVQSLRATVPVLLVLVGLMAVATLLSGGQTEWAVLAPRWLHALPVALAGVLIGNRLARHIPLPTMKRVLSTLLVISGLSLMRHVVD